MLRATLLLAAAAAASASFETIAGPETKPTPPLFKDLSVRAIRCGYTLASKAKLYSKGTIINPNSLSLNIYAARDVNCEEVNSTAALSPPDGAIYGRITNAASIPFSTPIQSATGDSSGMPRICLRIVCNAAQFDCGTVTVQNYYCYRDTTPAAAASSTTTIASSVGGIIFLLLICGCLCVCLKRQRDRQMAIAGGAPTYDGQPQYAVGAQPHYGPPPVMGYPAGPPMQAYPGGPPMGYPTPGMKVAYPQQQMCSSRRRPRPPAVPALNQLDARPHDPKPNRPAAANGPADVRAAADVRPADVCVLL
jgi:hypothetical protein